MMQHPSTLIVFKKVYAGHPGAGQLVTFCLHPAHNAGPQGQVISVDIPQLAQAAAERHLAEHERDKALTP